MDADYIREKITLSKSNAGRPSVFESPDELLEVACDYFEWVQDTPAFDKPRPMTMQGFCIHAGIGTSTWYDYKKKDEFSAVIGKIEQFMFEQKFSGAAVGVFKEQIISRDLGLSEKQEVDHSSSDGTMSLSDFYDRPIK